ncbi:MAG: hypothetical protein QM817_13905 [Archangium sp.]
MMKLLSLSLVLAAGVAAAQTSTEFSPPPMVPAAPPPMPPADPNAPPANANAPGTPPPPSNSSPSLTPSNTNPNGSGYQYSPYGQPKAIQKPGLEIGLMVSESLFGSLTAAGVTILPYFLLFNGGTLAPPINSIVFCLIFGAAPLAVAQTQVSLANGSRFYQSETWIPALVGLAGMGGVLAIYGATGWLPVTQASGGVPNGGSVVWLMIGAIGIVPLMQMAAINLFKQPKPGMTFALGDPAKKGGIAFAPPTITPYVVPGSGQTTVGAQLSLLRGAW